MNTFQNGVQSLLINGRFSCALCESEVLNAVQVCLLVRKRSSGLMCCRNQTLRTERLYQTGGVHCVTPLSFQFVLQMNTHTHSEPPAEKTSPVLNNVLHLNMKNPL